MRGEWGWDVYLRKFSKSNWRENKKDIFCIPNGDAPIDSNVSIRNSITYLLCHGWIFGLPKVDLLQLHAECMSM